MSFEPTYKDFFESFKFGHDRENQRYNPIIDGITPEKDGFLPGYLPRVWGTTPDTKYNELQLSRYQLKGLKNLPETVPYTNVWVSHNQITNLIGMPRYIGGDCFISQNPELNSLDGFPNIIVGNLRARECPKLTPLEFARVDAGNKVKGEIYWSAAGKLETLDKNKCTKAYYDLAKNSNIGEQEDITEI